MYAFLKGSTSLNVVSPSMGSPIPMIVCVCCGGRATGNATASFSGSYCLHVGSFLQVVAVTIFLPVRVRVDLQLSFFLMRVRVDLQLFLPGFQNCAEIIGFDPVRQDIPVGIQFLGRRLDVPPKCRHIILQKLHQLSARGVLSCVSLRLRNCP